MSTLEQDRAEMRAKGLMPIPLQESRVCLGRHGDDQCNACTLRVLPKDYTGYFPALAVIVPNLQERGLGQWKRLHCLDRRTTDTVVPGPSVGGSDGGFCTHVHTVRQGTEQGKPLPLGGGFPTSSAGLGLAQ